MLMCGEWAMGAAGMLRAAGHHNLVVPEGGPHGWAHATGGRLETGP